MNQKSEMIDFRIDPHIIYSIISSQAGTVSKAFLELVMNSIDAGASKVDIEFDNKTFRVSDDGKGFSGEDEINSFFRTFGTPHEEGDAVYGRFRMGRGQIMAFSHNIWRTNTFSMGVDIKEHGANYFFQKDLEYKEGVEITGTFYSPLSMSDFNKMVKELREYVKYSQIPVFLNGNQISEDFSTKRWTKITEEAYIKLDKSQNLSVYNLGVKVRDYSANDFGMGGVIVSKEQLNVNFARNDILLSQCKVWKQIRKDIKKFILDETDKKVNSRKSLTFEEKNAIVSDMIAGDLDWESVKGYPIFTDILGRHFSFNKLLKANTISIAHEKNPFVETIHKDEHALVLNPDK